MTDALECLSLLGKRGRVIAAVSLLAAIAAVTLALREVVPVSEWLSACVSMVFLAWLAVTDIKKYILPNRLLLIWLIFRVFILSVTSFLEGGFETVISSFIGAVSMGLFFLLVYFLNRRSLGGGDVKLSFVLGFAMGFPRVFTAVFIGLVFCAVYGLAGMIMKKIKRTDFMPLGPFVYAGTVAAFMLEI